MDVLALAKKYYPNLWDIDRIKALTAAGKLTPEQYKTITGEDYAPAGT